MKGAQHDGYQYLGWSTARARGRHGYCGKNPRTRDRSGRGKVATFDNLAPDWETLNKDPGFLKWLSEMDPLTGVERKRMLNDAVATFGGQRVASFFTA